VSPWYWSRQSLSPGRGVRCLGLTPPPGLKMLCVACPRAHARGHVLAPLPRLGREKRMCLAIPGKIVETLESDGLQMAKVSFGGIVKQVCLEYTPDAVPGDYVLVHVGFALSKVDPDEADRTYRLLEELNQLAELSEE